MSRSTFRTALVASLAVGVPTATAGGQAASSPIAPAVSAPVGNVRYDVYFDSSDARRGAFRVTMTFAVLGSGDVLLSLPVWTPGSYEISNFARYVSGFSAIRAAPVGPLVWAKIDADTWRIEPNGAPAVSVGFVFQVDSLGVDGAFTRPDFGFFNGTNLFLYPEGQPFDWPSALAVHTSPGWRVTTSMRPLAGDAGPAGTRRYRATSYHELVDMPFFIGRFDLDSARISERWVRLATYPAGGVGERARAALWRFLHGIIPVETALFGDAPWDDYTALMAIERNANLATALEHQTSFLGVYSPLVFALPALQHSLAHEIFHAWNGRRIRPAEHMPYRYDREQPSPWLWVVEGVTDYYADLVIARAGLIDSSAFFGLTSDKVRRVTEAPPASLRDVSLSTWIHPTDGTQGLEYDKGSIVAMSLDILIRDASDNVRSLDDAMRDLYASARRSSRGFSADEWWGAVSRAAGGRSFAEFAARYVEGREALPLDSILRLGGMRVAADTTRVPRLGLTVVDSSGVIVTSVDPEGTAGVAGVRPGDRLMKVGDVMVVDGGYGVELRVRYRDPRLEGLPLALEVRRGSQALTLAAPLQFAPRVSVRVAADPSASPKALRIRRGLMTGSSGH